MRKPLAKNRFRHLLHLKTAHFWQGPIKNLHLIIEKDSLNQIIFYWHPVGQKISSTTFE
ncbi:DUF4424 family protein [uncultured Bartonella sp.]|uniref:DUF4424 family protein n=1 Tax=uncultured Bartonella sp. TaxID=104108 RepID=UPI00342854D2